MNWLPQLVNQQLVLPDMLRKLSAVVAVRVDAAGYLRDWNRGFSRLLGGLDLQPGLDVREFFINPTLPLAVPATGQPALCFSGLLTLGDPHTQCSSISATIWRDAGGLFVIGEYDIPGLEHLSASVLELNNELAEAQRKLARQNAELKRSHEHIVALSLTDTLTEIANRRSFNQRIKTEVELSARTGRCFSMAMIDIDHFKWVNDEFGHEVGDIVLKSFVNCLKGLIRPYDFIARLGGEEFIILLPDTDIFNAVEIIERLRLSLAANVIAEIGRAVTASFGISQWREGDTPDEVLRRADQAAYLAKANGRNRVVTG